MEEEAIVAIKLPPRGSYTVKVPSSHETTLARTQYNVAHEEILPQSGGDGPRTASTTQRAITLKSYRPPKRTLNAASESGDIESIMFHIIEGADLNGRNASGHFPLAGAAHYGHAQAVRYLVEHGAKIDMLTTLNWSPLYIAAWRQHLDVAKVLLSAGASTKPRTYSGEYSPCPGEFTALHAAAFNGNTQMVRLLLKYGADARKKAGGRLPEDVARDQGHNAIERLLTATRRAHP